MSKVQGIMDLRWPKSTTEVWALIAVVQYYRYMCLSRFHVLAPLKEANSGPKGRKMPCNDELETVFKELKYMVSTEILLNYPYWEFLSQ